MDFKAGTISILAMPAFFLQPTKLDACNRACMRALWNGSP
jgi:hypothetical protein